MRAYSGAGRFSGTSPKMPGSRPASLDLMASQLRSTCPAVCGLGLAEHVRVAADELLGAVIGHLGEIARAALLEQQGEEVDLEEDVAELVEQLRVVAPVGGVGQLVGLLDRVRDDRALVLLPVPGALASQPVGDRVQPRERAHRLRPLRAHPVVEVVAEVEEEEVVFGAL